MKKISKKVRLIIVIALILAFVWFLIVSPMLTFHQNEKMLEDAARRYYEINPSQLPTGERIKTITLGTLYHGAFLKKDLFIPYTHKTCSVDNSWVKVRRENNEFKYYVYLECGIMNSTIDHKGPQIKLEGDKEITISLGDDFKDPGIRSVVDNADGKMKTTDVTVKSDVDTSKVGTYKISYTAFDSLKNKTVVNRTVVVVQKFYNTIKGDLGEANNYIGYPDDNYVRLSNILFRIVGVDKNNDVVLVTDEDISNVNFSKIDKWLDYFYDNLNEKTQKMIVEKEYCNMTITDTTVDTTQCNSYTEKRKIYIPSVVEINSASNTSGLSFMKPGTMSWTANRKSKSEAYLTRNMFFGEHFGKTYLAYPITDYYGVRPMMTVSGESLITGGNGTLTNPYVFGDVENAKGGQLINERYTGEYIDVDGFYYRILKPLDDGTTKVISYTTVGTYYDDVKTSASYDSDVIEYDPKNTSSVAYYINNRVAKFLDTKLFATHEIEVPIYKNAIIYGEEIKTEKYKVKLGAPDMFEMFSAMPLRQSNCSSYWYINSSKAKRITGAVSSIGVPLNQEIPIYLESNIRVVGFLKKGTVISSGKGTFESPYKIK